MTEAIFTSGVWSVKPGNEDEFLKEWKSFADWTLKNVKGMNWAYLLRDQSDRSRFISFGESEDEEAVKIWRGTPKFKEYFVKFKQLCENIQISTLDPVLHPVKR